MLVRPDSSCFAVSRARLTGLGFGHLEATLKLVAQRAVEIPEPALAGLKLRLAGLHFIVGEP
jgi:hypothetical protein